MFLLNVLLRLQHTQTHPSTFNYLSKKLTVQNSNTVNAVSHCTSAQPSPSMTKHVNLCRYVGEINQVCTHMYFLHKNFKIMLCSAIFCRKALLLRVW